MRVCVFCASSAKISEKHFEQTDRVAKELVNAGCTIVYGGGSVGLMGRLADTALSLGGEVIGVLPRFMDKVEWGHKNLTQINEKVFAMIDCPVNLFPLNYSFF